MCYIVVMRVVLHRLNIHALELLFRLHQSFKVCALNCLCNLVGDEVQKNDVIAGEFPLLFIPQEQRANHPLGRANRHTKHDRTCVRRVRAIFARAFEYLRLGIAKEFTQDGIGIPA